jgi:hypothetical protein
MMAGQFVKRSDEMTFKSAKKVKQRGWSFDKFARSVSKRAKDAGVKVNKTLMRQAYDKRVTVRDTVLIMQS